MTKKIIRLNAAQLKQLIKEAVGDNQQLSPADYDGTGASQGLPSFTEDEDEPGRWASDYKLFGNYCYITQAKRGWQWEIRDGDNYRLANSKTEFTTKEEAYSDFADYTQAQCEIITSHVRGV